jgi:bifunctional DNase/RNase
VNRAADARADFVLVLDSATTDGEVGIAANNVAWTDLCLGDADRFPGALALAERAAAKIPGHVYIRGTLAFALIENGRTREGVDILVTDSLQGEDDWSTAARACVLAIGVARLGNRPYAGVLLQVAEQLEPPSGLSARAREAITKAPSTGAPASVSPDAVPAAVHSLRYHSKWDEYVLVLGAYRRVYPTRIAAGGAERLRCLMTKAVLPGKREWIELLLASLRSRGASLSAISLDRQVARTARCTVSIKQEDGDWGFEVVTSDAAMMALLTGLPIRVSQELWAKYSMTDPSLKWSFKRFFREIFMWPDTPSPPRPRGKSRDPDTRGKSRDPDNSGSPQGGGRP